MLNTFPMPDSRHCQRRNPCSFSAAAPTLPHVFSIISTPIQGSRVLRIHPMFSLCLSLLRTVPIVGRRMSALLPHSVSLRPPPPLLRVSCAVFAGDLSPHRSSRAFLPVLTTFPTLPFVSPAPISMPVGLGPFAEPVSSVFELLQPYRLHRFRS